MEGTMASILVGFWSILGAMMEGNIERPGEFFLWLKFSELRTDPLSAILDGAAISDEIVLSNTFFSPLTYGPTAIAQAFGSSVQVFPTHCFFQTNLYC